MKDFEKIDWKYYNKPPYYQQWLCRDDTKKLTTFGDKGLEDVNDQVLALKDEWDLDNVKGWMQDRIGKLLNEKRNGNSDNYYRILLKLRTILNTNDGSVNSIIKAIKFLYQSEVIHIVPNYPAGLIIEHDGEGTPGLNFNKLLNEIIAAGVSFSTKEIFEFMEDMHFQDMEEFYKAITWSQKDIFTDTIYRNGRVLRDGKTIRDVQLEPLFRDGSVLRNGTIKERNGYFWGPAIGRIRAPIYRRSGIQDFLEIIQSDHQRDEWLSYTFRNGAVLRDGSVHRSGQNPHFNDSIDFHDMKSVLQDAMPLSENMEIEVKPEYEDDIGHHYLRDGRLLRNGKVYRSSESIIDVLAMQFPGVNYSDQWAANLVRNGSVLRDGTQHRNGKATESMLDKIELGYYLHHFRDGTYYRNGSIKRNAMVFIPA